jgi:predicted esterase
MAAGYPGIPGYAARLAVTSAARRGSLLLNDSPRTRAPAKPLFEAATANFTLHSPDAVNTGNSASGPLLLTMGKQDHTVPEAITKSTLKQYRHSDAVTDLQEFDRGHSLTIDAGWRDVADACLAWLSKYGL